MLYIMAGCTAIYNPIIVTQMRSSIIGYSPTTTTLDVHVISCQAAPAIAVASRVTIQLVCPLHLLTFCVALNSAQSHLTPLSIEERVNCILLQHVSGY